VKNGARRGWAVGVWSKNREEWQVVDFACHAYGLVGVSLYETLGPDVAQYMSVICCGPRAGADNLIAPIIVLYPLSLRPPTTWRAC
jgi:hypothetical protein